jgi:phosphoglycolate phosphatase-like HAD superfamily hydrolase
VIHGRPDFVFLDFDGVVMDSMTLKLDSYCHAFAGMGFHREAIRALQLASAGLSRQKTIPLMYESLSGRPMPEGLYREALARFTDHDDASRSSMVLMPGAEAFLTAARREGVRLAIVTGTPQEVIEKTVAHFDLGRFFARVCGTPGGKAEHLGRLLGEFGLSAGRCLYAGDAIKDQEAALAVAMPFVGINTDPAVFRAQGLALLIPDLGHLIPALQS